MKVIKSGNKEYQMINPPEDYPGKRYMKGNYCYEHHYVWWRETGEIIPEGYQIHHINGDKKDNRFENLEKIHISDHVAQHNKAQAIVGLFKCPVCGVEFVRERRKVYHKIKNNTPVFCSRVCGGKACGKGQKHEFEFKVEEWLPSCQSR